MVSKAEKLLERMRDSAANWKRRDLDRLYTGYGFVIRQGKKHDIVSHPKYKHLRATLPKGRMLLKAYVRSAVSLIDELRKLEEQENRE